MIFDLLSIEFYVLGMGLRRLRLRQLVLDLEKLGKESVEKQQALSAAQLERRGPETHALHYT